MTSHHVGMPSEKLWKQQVSSSLWRTWNVTLHSSSMICSRFTDHCVLNYAYIKVLTFVRYLQNSNQNLPVYPHRQLKVTDPVNKAEYLISSLLMSPLCKSRDFTLEINSISSRSVSLSSSTATRNRFCQQGEMIFDTGTKGL